MTETVWIIDNAEPQHYSAAITVLERGEYRRKWIKDLDQLEDELASLEKSLQARDEALREDNAALAETIEVNPPMAALVDLNFFPHQGLDAVYRLRKSPATRRTVPILFTAHASKGGLLANSGADDLHVILCAAACNASGILICSKEDDLGALSGTLSTIRGHWRNPSYGEDDMIGVRHGDLRLVRPLSNCTQEPPTSLVHTLLGTGWKSDYWAALAQSPNMPDDVFRNYLHMEAAHDFANRPAYNLQARGGWHGPHPAANAYTQFLDGDIGRLARAWSGVQQNFFSTAILNRELHEPQAAGYATSAQDFRAFVGRYAALLGRPETERFATWYLRQSWVPAVERN